jgi:hypothetical protein
LPTIVDFEVDALQNLDALQQFWSRQKHCSKHSNLSSV